MAAKKRGLGRGLDALLGSAEQGPSAVGADTESVDGRLAELAVDLIRRGKYQPRRDMHPEALEDLANSIRAQGVMQPIVVRPVDDGCYEIIAGERRWRAAQMADLDTIPAVIREVGDEAAGAMALIENIQREDLNPLEEAIALARLRDDFGLTQQQVADAVGKSRATVTNLLRLLALREDVKTLLEHGDIEMGHARAILGLPQELQSQAAGAVVGKGLSVRQAEALVRRMIEEKEHPKPAPAAPDPDIRRLEEEIGEKVGAPVTIQHTPKGKGRIVFRYNSLDELEGILAHLK